MKSAFLIILGTLSLSLMAVPSAPVDPEHPGYLTRGQSVMEVAISTIRSGSVLYLPQTSSVLEQKIPLIVFAHGQALKVKHYELLFKAMASKGFAVLYPQYDKGFFDRDWRRMGADYDAIVEQTLKDYPQLDNQRVLYSGHSKGGYIGLMALAHRSKSNYQWFPKASIFYSPAGFEEGSLTQIPTTHELTLVWPVGDSIIKKDLIDEIFLDLSIPQKQKIIVQGYEGLQAGHFFILSSRSLFGGSNGVGPFHWYGALTWSWGALKDSYYLKGEGALDSGDVNFPHIRE